MNGFYDFLKLETKHVLMSKITAGFIIALFALSMILTQIGVFHFKNTLIQQEVFQQVEKEKLKQYQNWRQYGSYGFRLIALPAPVSIFFTNSVTMYNMTSYMDSGERLKIYQSLKGENVFEMRKKWLTDFSGIILFFGGLLALLYGYLSYYRKEYLRFLSSISSSKRCFAFVFLSRSILLLLLLAFITAGAYLLVLINGIHVPINKYLVLSFFGGYLTLLFFYALGTVFGSFNSKILGGILGLTAWLLSLFIMPTGVNLFIAYKAKAITPVYKLEIEKLKILMGFEKRMIEKEGIFKNGKKVSDSVRDRMLEYWNNEFREIQALEEEMMTRMRENTSLFHKISAFFPTTFYLSLNNEISSRGYESLMDFYDYLLKMKRDFFKTYLDNVYFKKTSKVESFFKEEKDNVFQTRARLPKFLLLGFAANLVYILIITFISYALFKKSLYGLPKRKKQPVPPKKMVLKPGQFRSLQVWGNLLNQQLFALLSNETRAFKKKAYPLDVTLNGKDLHLAKEKQNFICLCSPAQIPGDIRVKDLIQLVSHLIKAPVEKKEAIIGKYQISPLMRNPLHKLDPDQLGRVWLAILDIHPFDIYFMENITSGMTRDFAIKLKERIDELWENNALVLFLFSDTFLQLKNVEPGRYFLENHRWVHMLEDCRDIEEKNEE